MSEEKLKQIESILEELAVATMLLGPDDMPALGQILEKTETIIEIGKEIEETDLLRVGMMVKVGLESTILKELENTEGFFDLLPECVTTLQELVRSRQKKGEPAAAPDGFLEKLSKAAGTQGENMVDNVAGPKKDEPKKRKPEEEKPKQATAEEPNKTAAKVAAFPADLDVDLATGFITESLDMLQEIEVNILVLENDSTDKEAINAIFRPFHTIKGVSGFLNLMEINRFAHQVENLLDEARSDKITLEGPLIDLILDAVDLLRAMISGVSTFIQSGEGDGRDYGVDPFIQRIKTIHEAALKAKAGDPAKLGEIMVAQGAVSQEDLDQSLAEQGGEGQGRPLGAVLVESKKASPKAVARGLRDQKMANVGVQSIKVDTIKLDNIVDAVGELVIALSLVAENPKVAALSDRKLERDMGQLSRITSELQKTAMALRMVPINQTFQRMGRVVRDLSRKSGKQARLIMEGQDTEIDRTMVDAIYDPLVHMVRNSMDHGLEEKDQRATAGKPEEGWIAIRAYHQGGKIVIEIEDDGKGLDPKKILAKAIERGIVSPDADLNEHEINNLILQAGFSTAEKITDISGRGVGMDVVRESVEKLRGSLEIQSKLGQGSKFTIRLPLTMAIIEGMVVKSAGQRYIIPALSVEEVLKPERSAIHTAGGGRAEMVMVRGRLLPLVRLNRLFWTGAGKVPAEDQVVVVVESEGQHKAVVVDELLGKQEVVIKSLGGALGQLRGLSGGAILGDGRVGLILDVAGLFAIAESEHFQAAEIEEEPVLEIEDDGDHDVDRQPEVQDELPQEAGA